MPAATKRRKPVQSTPAERRRQELKAELASLNQPRGARVVYVRLPADAAEKLNRLMRSRVVDGRVGTMQATIISLILEAPESRAGAA